MIAFATSSVRALASASPTPLADLGRIAFVMPGTEALRQGLVTALGKGWGLLMQNHGLIAAVRGSPCAAKVTQICERRADVILGCYALGRKPPVLSESVAKELSLQADLMA